MLTKHKQFLYKSVNILLKVGIGMDYPAKIKEYREKMFLSQNDLAKLLGVSFVTVNRWEKGHFVPTISCKRKLHKLFVEANIVE